MTHNREHIPQLDGYRGFAALVVLVSHYANRTLVGIDTEGVFSKSVYNWTLSDMQILVLGALGNGAGQVGVMIFFSLSSFLMFHLYFDKPATTIALKRFFISRIARIFPLYYLAVVIAALSTAYLPWQYIEMPLDYFFQHLVFLKGKSVLWTIAPELLFYAFFALTWWVSQGRPLYVAPVALAVLVGENALPVIWKSYTADFFCTGYLVWLYFNSPYRIRLFGWKAAVVTFIFSLGFFIHLPAVHKIFIHQPSYTGWQEWSYLLVILLFFILVIDCSWMKTLFSCKPMRFLGNISFSLYLLHLFVFDALEYIDALRPNFVRLSATMILCLAVSAIFYYGYERPARSFLRNRLTKTTPDRTAVQTE